MLWLISELSGLIQSLNLFSEFSESYRMPWFCFLVWNFVQKFSWTTRQFETNPRSPVWEKLLGNQWNILHKLNAMLFFLLLTGSLVALVGTWKSRIDITVSKPWNTDRTVINGLLNQFWHCRESPKPSVPYRLKWEPAYCISIVFFLWIPLWVYVVFLPTPCNVFLWNVFHKLFAQTSCVIWDALTKLFFLWVQEKKTCYLQTANFLPRGLADFISGALLFSFHSLGFEATIKPYVWYCVMWFRPREKQSFIFKENPIFPNEMIITNRIVEIYG